MRRNATTMLVGSAMALGLAVGPGPAGAIGHPPLHYKTCRALHTEDEFGVARSEAAAARQSRRGNLWPVVDPPLYRANKRLDRDRDGAACEVRGVRQPRSPGGGR